MKNLEQILVDINQQATRINRAADDHHLLIGDLEIIARESKKAIESVQEVLREAREALEKMKWIPIETEIPKPNLPVIAFKPTKENKGFRVRACWIPEKFMEDGGEFLGDCVYDEESDNYYWPQGWYEWNEEEGTHWMISGITHWMHLPANPHNSAIESILEKIKQFEQ